LYTVTGASKHPAKVFGFLSDERAFTSKAPALYRMLMELVGISGTCTAFMVEPEELEAAVQGLRALNPENRIKRVL
jgi:shikimate 5-dehydrogenase